MGFPAQGRQHQMFASVFARAGGNVTSRWSPGGLRDYIDPLASDPDPLKEFRFDGSKYQHAKLQETERVKTAIKNGLVWKP